MKYPHSANATPTTEGAGDAAGLIDGCGRRIDHLRISLTDHCNLACRYCVTEGRPQPVQMIDPEFAYQVVRWLAERHAIRHARLTGGEPLLHPGLIPLIERLARIEPLHEITLTTNAQALVQKAQPLRDAGLTRINVSLDTLDPRRFADLTRRGELRHTLAGIEAGVRAGLTPVKLNVVVQRGLNDNELCDLAAWGLSRGCHVRFLEVMPIGPLMHVANEHLVSAAEVLERLRQRFELRPIASSLGQPAVDYAVTGEGMRGVVGIIAPTTRPFCAQCRRLRITSRGLIVACLHDGNHFDVNPCWNGRVFDADGADKVLRAAVDGKPAIGSPAQSLTMLSLGG